MSKSNCCQKGIKQTPKLNQSQPFKIKIFHLYTVCTKITEKGTQKIFKECSIQMLNHDRFVSDYVKFHQIKPKNCHQSYVVYCHFVKKIIYLICLRLSHIFQLSR